MFKGHWDRSSVIAVSAILAVELLICGFFIVYMNQLKGVQQQRLEKAKQELATLQNDAGQLTQLREQYEDAKLTLAHLEPGITPELKPTYLPTLLSQIQLLADEVGCKLENVVPVTGSKNTANPPPAEAADSSAGAAAGAPSAKLEVEKVTLNLQLKGKFAEMMRFLEKLKTFPKIIEVETIQLRPSDSSGSPVGVSPELGISMSIEAVILPLDPGVEL